MRNTGRTVRALVVSRIANLERDLRVECAPFLASSSLEASTSGSPAESEQGFELELVSYTPPAHTATGTVEADAEECKLVRLMQESEVVVADPGLVAPHLRHLLPGPSTPTAHGLRWMQSTWAGVDSLFRAVAHDQPDNDAKPVPSSRPSPRM
jgi:hypothetical protein